MPIKCPYVEGFNLLRNKNQNQQSQTQQSPYQARDTKLLVIIIFNIVNAIAEYINAYRIQDH